jgi:hypothetical protein
VLRVIRSLQSDKALGPDGFTTRFLQVAWDIIQVDLMWAFDAFWRLDTRNLHVVNYAALILLPKKERPTSIRDYRPISLIDMVGKLVLNVLANRLAPHVDKLVHVNSSAFIKGCFIQDNFKLVRASTRALHARKKLALLHMVDIARAFNSVA